MTGAQQETGLIGGIEKRDIVIVDYDASWPMKYEQHRKRISDCLGEKVIALEHVGSTAVPGLAAKPIIDIDLIVADSSDEGAYLPVLVEAGYDLRVREPDWQEHRMFRTRELDVHLHVFSTSSAEFKRHLALRDWLRAHASDREAYAAVKRDLASKSWDDMNAYAEAKTEIIERILKDASGSTTSSKIH